ncbi:MAG TPA: hypothetical protein VII53_09995 [Solirubrobacteraceae bacterium]
MLAYVFWHRPREGSAVDTYEQALAHFHRSLAHAPPAGFQGSAAYRIPSLPAGPPWLGSSGAVSGAVQTQQAPGAGPGYEDWYFVDDYTALGVLNEAAVGHGHRSVHDDLARHFGGGAGGLYGLIEGHPPDGTASLEQVSLAVWVGRSPGVQRRMLGELLGDGMDPRHASLWRRQLVLGPAPEFCLLAHKVPPGVAPTRLPKGWTATVFEREALWTG